MECSCMRRPIGYKPSSWYSGVLSVMAHGCAPEQEAVGYWDWEEILTVAICVTLKIGVIVA